MGMDVYGLAPTAERGKYFGNNICFWHPLWTYVEELAPHLTDGVKGHYNAGHGLTAHAAASLATILSEEIASGRTLEYEAAYNARMAAMPDEVCNLCAGTGTRHDGLRIWMFHTKFTCNACYGNGTRRPHVTSYVFCTQNVIAFRDFVAASGGFVID